MIHFEIRGIEDMNRRVRQLAAEAPKEFGRAQKAETVIEAKESAKKTPVEFGPLKKSVRAEGPDYQGKNIVTYVTAGNEEVDYAVYVHEDLDAHHEVGEAKFIESTLRESSRFLAGRIARRIDLKRLLK